MLSRFQEWITALMDTEIIPTVRNSARNWKIFNFSMWIQPVFLQVYSSTEKISKINSIDLYWLSWKTENLNIIWNWTVKGIVYLTEIVLWSMSTNVAVILSNFQFALFSMTSQAILLNEHHFRFVYAQWYYWPLEYGKIVLFELTFALTK